MNQTKKIIYQGNILAGFEAEQVRNNLASKLGLSATKIEHLFASEQMVIKKGLSLLQAQQYVDALTEIGLDVIMADDFNIELELEMEQETNGNDRNSKFKDNFADKHKYTDEIPPTFSRSFKGRIGRLSYVRSSVIISIVYLLLLIPIVGLSIFLFMQVEKNNNSTGSSIFFAIILAILFLAIIIWGIFAKIRILILRLHDMDCPGWLSFIYFIPYINLIFILVAIFAPGITGENQHGLQPKRGPLSYAIIAAVIFITIFIITIIVAIAVAAH